MEQFLIEEKLRDYKLKVYDPFLMKCDRINPNEWSDLKDFLTTDGSAYVETLNSISVQRLRKLVSNWIYIKNKTKRIDEVDGVDFRSVLNLENNFKWVELLSENSFSNEGLLMNNCVAGYYNKSKNKERCIIYSLRNEKNEPKVTVEYYSLLNKIIQVRGRSNNLINLKYSGFLAELFNYLNSKCLNHENYNRDLTQVGSLHISDVLENYRDLMQVGSLHVSDVLENLGLYRLDGRFATINKDSNIICPTGNFYYKKRLGKIRSIVCKRLRLDFKDYNFLKDTKIETEELVIRGVDSDSDVELSKNWTVAYFDDRRSNLNWRSFSNDFGVGHPNGFVFFDYFDVVGVRLNQSFERLVELTGLLGRHISLLPVNEYYHNSPYIRKKILGKEPSIKLWTPIDQILEYTANGFENNSIRVVYNIGLKTDQDKDFRIIFDSIVGMQPKNINPLFQPNLIKINQESNKMSNSFINKQKFEVIVKPKKEKFQNKNNRLSIV